MVRKEINNKLEYIVIIVLIGLCAYGYFLKFRQIKKLKQDGKNKKAYDFINKKEDIVITGSFIRNQIGAVK